MERLWSERMAASFRIVLLVCIASALLVSIAQAELCPQNQTGVHILVPAVCKPLSRIRTPTLYSALIKRPHVHRMRSKIHP